MSFIIQSKNPDGPGSCYFNRIDKEGIAIFTDQIVNAKTFEKSANAREFIKEMDLTECHVLPS